MRHSVESLAIQVAELAQEIGHEPTSNEFTRRSGVSSSTITRHGGWSEILAAARASIPAGAIRSRVLDERAEREHRLREDAKAKRNELKGVVRVLERQVSELEEARDFLLGVKELSVEWTPRPIVARERKGGLPEALYVMMASDWHVGERVRPEQIGGRNEYNPDIAQERGYNFWRSNLTMLNAARAAWRIDRILLALIGDMITGYIHEEYESENFLSPTEETMLAMRMLIEGIDFLLEKADVREILIATCNGNHGRTTKKKRVNGSHRNSYEFMLYQLLALHYKDEKRVKFQLGTGVYNTVDAYGFLVRMSHGDQIRSGGGVGGLAPPLYRVLGRLPPVGIDLMGHYHQLDFLRRFARNGSLIGWNLFAEYLGCEEEPPMQGSFVVCSKHKIACNFNPIFVTKLGK